MSEGKLVTRSFQGWQQQAAQTRRNIKFAYFAIVAIKQTLLQKSFDVLKKRREDYRRIRVCRRKYMDQLLKTVFFNFRSRVYQRKLVAFVDLHFKRRLASSVMMAWHLQVQQSGAVATARLKQAEIIKRFKVLQAWRFTTFRLKQLRDIIESYQKQKKVRLLSCTFSTMREQTRIRRLAAIRYKSVLAYLTQKQQLKAFAALLLASQQSRKNKKNKALAAGFFRE